MPRSSAMTFSKSGCDDEKSRITPVRFAVHELAPESGESVNGEASGSFVPTEPQPSEKRRNVIVERTAIRYRSREKCASMSAPFASMGAPLTPWRGLATRSGWRGRAFGTACSSAAAT